jgi:hypothetical protein
MKFKPLNAKDAPSISPERQRIARIFKNHIEAAIAELGVGYDVTLQGSFLINGANVQNMNA